MRRFLLGVVWACMTACLLMGCGQREGFRPIEPDAITFWDRQTTETAELLREIVQEFNTGREGLAVEAQYSGNYGVIFQKIRASIQAGDLPDMAVAYQSMTSEYVGAGAVVPLDNLIADSEIGLDDGTLQDIFAAVLETSRLPELDDQMYSFPFCKSVLMMYFNKRVLAKAGLTEPPKTWDEFLEQSRRVKAATGNPAYAVSVDASTVDGMIFSAGGGVLTGGRTLFDSPESLRVFELFETLAREDLAYTIQPETQDDKVALAQDRVAFVFRSSSHRTSVVELMEGDFDRWGIAPIPQDDPSHPGTVLYGPNICIFQTGPERNRISWEFVKYFTSQDTSVRWALGTGYLPIRKSAVNDPRLQAFWGEWEYNRAAFDCLAFAKSEPSVAGWQEIRGLIEEAQAAVLTGLRTAKEATAQLKREADAVLAGR